MTTNFNHGFANFAKTILIVFMVCLTFLISTNPSVIAKVGFSASTTQNAIGSETLLDPVPGGPGFIMVSPYGFRPLNYNCLWDVASGVYNPHDTLQTYLVAALTLPQGASINQMTLYFRDYDMGDDLYLSLIRKDAIGFEQTLIGIAPEVYDSNFQYISVSDIAEGLEVIDNQSYSYFLFAVLPPWDGTLNIEITNVRIDYEYSNNLPLVIK